MGKVDDVIVSLYKYFFDIYFFLGMNLIKFEI